MIQTSNNKQQPFNCSGFCVGFSFTKGAPPPTPSDSPPATPSPCTSYPSRRKTTKGLQGSGRWKI